MKDYETKFIRNVTLAGHNGAGKTILTEALLYSAGATNKMGSIENGSTISDYDPEEQKRQMSINLTVNQFEYKKHKVNILDTPGYMDFVAEMASGIYVSENTLFVVSASSGIGVGTEDAWEYSDKFGTHKIVFVNKMDNEHTDFFKILDELKNTFEKIFVPITIPIGSAENLKGVVNVLEGKAYIYKDGKREETDIPSELANKIEEIKTAIIEAAAETDEELMNKYFEEGTLSPEEISKGIVEGIKQNSFVPVLAGAAKKNIGVIELLDFIVKCLPSPEGFTYKTEDDKEIKVSPDGKFVGFVFKSVSDPYAGKLNYFKVIRGELTTATNVINASQDRHEKISHLNVSLGKEHKEVSKLCAGDIGVVAKLDTVHYGDTLSDASEPVKIKRIELPKPIYTVALEADSRKDEEKLGGNIMKLIADDPTLSIKRDAELKQTLLSGMGEIQLEVLVSRLKDRYGVNVKLKEPRIPYRETIEKKAEAQGKYKKQTGGHGQYGDVHIRFEPLPRGSGFEFVDAIVGGVVPARFIPSVEKGLKEALQKGFLAGYPMVDIKATLFFGSYHSVDSSDLAFQVAASLAFKNAMPNCKPVILEPIMKVEVIVPEEYMGDVMGDINNKRGKILGMEAVGKGKQKIKAEVPMAEMTKYPIELRSLARGRGKFTMEFSHYEKVPPHIQEKIIEEAKKWREEEESKK